MKTTKKTVRQTKAEDELAVDDGDDAAMSDILTKKEEGFFAKTSSLSSIASIVIDILFAGVRESIMRSANEFVDAVQERIVARQKRMIRHFFVVTCMCAGLCSLILSLCFYLTDTLHWPRAALFLMMGVILVVIASLRAYLLAQI